MLVYCFLFLLFLKPKSVYSFKDSVNLEIDQPDDKRFKVENTQLDNVFYKHFTPLDNTLVRGVNEFTNKIWESNGYCSCVYTLVAYKNQLPQLIYLKLDCGHSVKEHFYNRFYNEWKRVDVYEYSYSIFDLRKSTKFDGFFGLNIFNSYNSKYYTTEYSSKTRPYTFFTPNYGYFCTSVYYKSKELWKAKVYGDRCVAAWAYIHNGLYYMIRLLVSEYNDQSKIITYTYSQNQWVHTHTLDENFSKAFYLQRPDNFLYPNYTLNFKKLPLPTPSPLESLTSKDFNYEIKEDNKPELQTYLDLTDVYYKPRSLFNLNSTDNTNKFEPLKLSSSVSNLLFTSSRYVDNVEYKTYSPTKDTIVTKVVDGDELVWESKNKLERCVYALAPQKDGNAVSLYLLLNVNGELRQAFMDKVNGKWVRSNYEDYKKKLNFLKGFATNYDFVLDLGNKKLNPEYSVEIKSGKDGYFFFTPKIGYACRTVTYNNETIWQTENPFDKCVAIWSYENYGKVYYVRLLVQYYDDKHDIISYLYTRDKWEWISSYNYSRLNKTRYSKLLDFYHPEYDFNNDILDYEFEGAGVYPPSHETRTEGFKFKTSKSITPENSEYDNGTLYSKSKEPNVEKLDNEITNEVKYDIFSEGKKLPNVSETNEYLDYMEGKYSTNQNSNTNEVKYDIFSEGKKLPNVSETNEYLDYMEGKYYSTNQNNEDNVEKGTTNNLDKTKKDNALEPLDPSNYQPLVKVVTKKDCLHLDVSNRLYNYQYESSAIFDGKIKLVSYLPPPGMYFDLITDGKLPLFIGFRLSHLSKGVNFYLKNGDFYLADVIFKVKNDDLTLYFKKSSKYWHVISQETFINLLNEL